MTNAIIESIVSRSTTKKYDPAITLSDEQIRELVRIATTAPTSFHMPELALHRGTHANGHGVLGSADDHWRIEHAVSPPFMARTPVSRRSCEDNYSAKPEATHKLLKGMRRREHSEWTCSQRGSHHESRSTP